MYERIAMATLEGECKNTHAHIIDKEWPLTHACTKIQTGLYRNNLVCISFEKNIDCNK